MSGPSRLLVYTARQLQRSKAGVASYRTASSSAATTSSTPITASQDQVQTPQPRRPKKKSNGQAFSSIRSPPQRLAREEKEAIALLPLALNASDVEESWKAWLDISERGEVRSISTEDINALIKIIEDSNNVHNRLMIIFGHLYQEQKWESLSECMKAQLRVGNDEVLLDMAAKVWSPWYGVRQLEGIKSTPVELVSEAVVLSAIVCSRKAKPDVLPLIRLVRPLGLKWISRAGSVQNKEVEFQSNGSAISLGGAIKVLKNFYQDAESARLAFTFCRHAMLAWGLDFEDPMWDTSNGLCLDRRMYNLSGANQFESIKMLLETAMEAKEAEFGSWLSMTAHYDENADWNERCWCRILAESIKKRKPDLAAQIWSAYSSIKGPNEMTSKRIWNALLDGYSTIAEYDSVQSTWKQMLASGTVPDESLYTTMMTALFRNKRVGDAILIFEDYQEKVAKKELVWNEMVFTSMLHGLHKNNHQQVASDFFQDMMKEKAGFLKPSTPHINVFLKQYGEDGDFVKTTEMLKVMTDLNLKPDKFTYHTLMDTFTQAGIEGAAEKVFMAMSQGGIKIDTITASAIIKNFLFPKQDGSAINFAAAFEVLYHMETHGPAPDSVTYINIMRTLLKHSQEFEQFYKLGNLRQPYESLITDQTNSKEIDSTTGKFIFPNHFRLAFGLMNRMSRRNILPDAYSYHVLIRELLDPNQLKLIEGKTVQILAYLKKAMGLVKECQASSVANGATWIIILEGLIQQSKSQDSIVAQKASENLMETVKQIKMDYDPLRSPRPLLNLLGQADLVLRARGLV